MSTKLISNALRHTLLIVTVICFINGFPYNVEQEHQIRKRSADLSTISYALLMAGSCGIANYRHQADVAHAYHVLISKGVPASRIVVIMCDDVANSKKNPERGTLKNEPNGPDYYRGLNVDYRVLDVGVDTFSAVLTGNWNAVKKVGTGRILESTPNDNIFLYITGHAEEGVFFMPFGPNLSREILQNTIKKAKFRTMSVYIEACKSGSLLQGMENDPKVFGMTASNATANSYASNCNINGLCYGDEFSFAWMTDSEKFNLRERSLVNQFDAVKSNVRGSQVTRFGSPALYKYYVAEYQGFKLSEERMKQMMDQNVSKQQQVTPLSSKDATAYYYETRASQATDEDERTEARKMVEKLKSMDVAALNNI